MEAPPPQDPVETVFDAIQNVLDSENAPVFKKSDCKRLTYMIERYLQEVRLTSNAASTEGESNPTAARSKRPRQECSSDSHDGCASADCKDCHDKRDTEEEEEEEEQMLDERVLQCEEVGRNLEKVRRFILQRLPFNSITDEQKGPAPHRRNDGLEESGLSSGTRTLSVPSVVHAPVYHVDFFLYPTEDDLGKLETDGLVKRDYCKDCGGTNIGLTEFISHSLSAAQFEYLSCYLIPLFLTSDSSIDSTSNAARCIVDVGSRYGLLQAAVLFAADAGALPCSPERPLEVIGVEMNAAFCQLERELLTRFTRVQPQKTVAPAKDGDASQTSVTYHVPLPIPTGRVNSHARAESGLAHALSFSVVNDSCFGERGGAESMRRADIAVFHNVFEFFSTPSDHLRSWVNVRSLMCRPGQVLLCVPKLEESLSSFSMATILEVFPEYAKEKDGAGACESEFAAWFMRDWVEPASTSRVKAAQEAYLKSRVNDNDDDHHHDGVDCCGDDHHDHDHHHDSDSDKQEDEESETEEQIRAIHSYITISKSNS